MSKFILGKKIGMGQIYNDKGEIIPITIIDVGENKVTQVKTEEKDGYEAVQVKMDKTKREFKVSDQETRDKLPLGDKIEVSIFEAGDLVKVTGTSKGKGFAGAMKRHGFHGAPASHGHKSVKRHVGSIGGRYPQHTLKGLRMAGRMGAVKSTSRGLKIVVVDPENKILAVSGAVPGNNGGVVAIQSQ
jgi:large subunit ribosomal protein L3